MRMSKLVVAGLVCGALAAGGAQAQVQQGLEYSITPYLWAMGLNGDIALGEVGGTVDVGFSDLASNLDMTVPIHFEAKGPVWTLIAEINWAALSQDLGSDDNKVGELDLDMLTAELLSGWQFANFTELIFGVRYVRLDAELGFDLPVMPAGGGNKFDATQDWVDPLVGIRYGGPISRRWQFNIRLDAGGFGLGSDITWNFRTGFAVEVSDVTTLGFGWHTMDTDYDNNNFVYDMTQQGPEFYAKFKF